VKYLLALLVTCISALAQTPKTVDLPLIDCDRLLCIDANTASGQILRLVLDLGARNAYLDVKAAQKLGIAPPVIHRCSKRPLPGCDWAICRWATSLSWCSIPLQTRVPVSSK
jgi:hypothetical protein